MSILYSSSCATFLDCTCYFLVIQLTLSYYLITKTTSIYSDLLLDRSNVSFSHDCIRMPVLTRSMMKRGLQPAPGSVGILTCPTCYTDGKINSFSIIAFPPLLPSLSSVPELIDQCNISLSSSESDDSSILSSDEDFEILTFKNFKISVSPPGDHSCHISSLSQASKMESDCVENSTPSIKVDGGSSNQDNIMQMLNIISTKIMDTIKDLRHQLLQNDLKYTAELQKLSQENETFQQKILADMQRSNLGSVTGPVSTQVLFHNLTSPTAVSPTITSSGLSSTSSPDSSSQDFQQQMMTMLNATFTKLTTVMTESKAIDSKSDWPKFAGDMKKFKHWYWEYSVK